MIAPNECRAVSETEPWDGIQRDTRFLLRVGRDRTAQIRESDLLRQNPPADRQSGLFDGEGNRDKLFALAICILLKGIRSRLELSSSCPMSDHIGGK
jgi:hypothetical protein